MLIVKTYIKQSQIEGIGLFAGEFIKKGSIIWRFRQGFDMIMSSEVFNTLPQIGKEAIIHNMYFSKDQNVHILMPDDARFFNHSKNPNTETIPDDEGQIEQMTVASRDIQLDEEITCNYFEFDLDTQNKHV